MFFSVNCHDSYYKYVLYIYKTYLVLKKIVLNIYTEINLQLTLYWVILDTTPNISIKQLLPWCLILIQNLEIVVVNI